LQIQANFAEEDFRDFRALPETDLSFNQLVDLGSTLYLFAQFWARLEILRRESFQAELSVTKEGMLLLSSSAGERRLPGRAAMCYPCATRRTLLTSQSIE
jgi:hypothetical protein